MSSLQKFHRRTNGGAAPFVAVPPVDKSSFANHLNFTGTPLTSNTQIKYGTASVYIAQGNSIYTDKAATYQLGTSDFTIETWVYVVNTPSSSYPAFLQYGDGYQYAIGSFINHASWPNKITIEGNCSGGSFLANGNIDIQQNVWTHVAYVRQSSNLKIYVNGVLDFTIAIPGNGSFNGTHMPGFFTNARNGVTSGDLIVSTLYLDEFRVTKGVARYTSNFTPPSTFPTSSSDPNWSNVVLLLNGE
jgi:hypothetical protein